MGRAGRRCTSGAVTLRGEGARAVLLIRLVDELAAKSSLDLPGGSRGRGHGPGELTDREQQVLALIAEGLTNGQIGQRLFISTKTVSVHVSAILRKLGVASRTEAAVLARAGHD